MSELEALLAQVDADRLMAHVRNITQFERIPGSDEERAAFDCIEKALVACGLSPKRQMIARIRQHSRVREVDGRWRRHPMHYSFHAARAQS